MLSGCAQDLSHLEEVEVRQAWVVGAHLTDVAVIGGGTWGKGTLEVLGMEGEELTVPVTLRGGSVGFAFDFSRSEPQLQLELPDEPVTADQLLGSYRGSGEEITVVAGVDVKHLHNEHGVGIDQACLAWGLGINFAYEWLNMRLDHSRTVYQDVGDDDTGLEAAP
jgi:hypothetical protein